MTPALLIRLRPLGPWRYGPDEGGRDRVDNLYRSDRLYSALTLAFGRLGILDEWLEATARAAQPAVAFSSLFPFQGDTLFITPPATLWPPPAAALRMSSPVFQTKVRWRSTRFAPIALVETLLLGQKVLAEQWVADAASGCLLRRDRPQSSPFRVVVRTNAAVDRLGSTVEPHSTACVEFEPAAGLWTVVVFSDKEAETLWKPRLRAAFRLLADSGFGARRSSGWGLAAEPEFQDGTWPAILLPKVARAAATQRPPQESNHEGPPLHWLLSLYSPAATDDIDWSNGHYSTIVRGGRVESPAGTGAEKKLVRMVAEGSVIASAKALVGTAVDVAPDGFTHPVYRSGFALSLLIPPIVFSGEPAPVETASEPEPETDVSPNEPVPAETESEPETKPHGEAKALTVEEPRTEALPEESASNTSEPETDAPEPVEPASPVHPEENSQEILPDLGSVSPLLEIEPGPEQLALPAPEPPAEEQTQPLHEDRTEGSHEI